MEHLECEEENIESIREEQFLTTEDMIDKLIEKKLNDSYYEGWLDVDHKDGNPLNNSEENLQTLCKCCHNFKTLAEGDYATAGRKTLRKQMKGKYESN